MFQQDRFLILPNKLSPLSLTFIMHAHCDCKQNANMFPDQIE